ncbi:hypothetical protein CWC48_29970 [Pseudomonas sp. S10E 269]|nr:hypothetical protein CWC49_29885 [Pseudomonas sp. S09F 262]PJK37558.1 hypothetical protein CWC48_29970 [Pseudomonas sp. S10E 269]
MHEQALFERLVTYSGAADYGLGGFSPQRGNRLIRSSADDSQYGVGLIHTESKSVVFWAQVQICPGADIGMLPVIHFVCRRKADPELWRGARGTDGRLHVGQLMLIQLLNEGHVLITRTGMSWGLWQELLSMATALGYSIYTLASSLLSKHDSLNPDREWALMEDPLGLTLLSIKADLHGRDVSIAPDSIEEADRAFLEAR